MKFKFLPEDYRVPQSESNWYEFDEGENKFRIVSHCVTGWLWWEDEDGQVLSSPAKNCTVRYVRQWEELPKPVRESKSFRHFWAFLVFCRKAERVMVCKITQTSIMRGITSIVKSPEWSDPATFDLVVTREGDGLATKYSVMALPMQPLDDGIWQLVKDSQIDLEALFEGRDPFGGDDEEQAKPAPANAGGKPRPPFPSPQTNGPTIAR